MTPGRPQLPRTPRLCFKENDNSRFGTHDFPSTPKFGRSESTPELHRIRKLDQSLHMVERNTTQEKAHYNNVLQESNASNLLTLTSDSLPDIFQDKVSKWGYCPSSTNTQQGFGTKSIIQNLRKSPPSN
ncbi:hypothetical protein DAPPUDRAFT_332606 [Daphnia pulex]|uniref:Uncharacterized protein n=1 Tax=Daphnia pulex TaxID=6669 RepID=E9HQE6_DAPPU|nr:hypothetical protein DAPPUDRAFT_332606 [Daphnia pulex]|eukprot:EFX66045.1 hypothetical protein DAPPUDRAFT_332606 [Daphnia pulex]